MADPIPIKVRITQLANNAYEIRTVVKGRFYKRQYIGFSRKNALKKFGEWIKTKL